MSVDLSFLVSCYNEEKNVVGAIETILSCLSGRALTYEILVMDDGSTDATAARAEAYRAAHPALPLSLYRNEENRGLGWNYGRGAGLAKGRYYMLVHGDNENSKAVISLLLDRLGEADIILPYVDNQRERPLLRRLVSKAFIFTVGFLSGHWLRYYTGPVLHLRETVRRFNARSAGPAYQAEIVCQALNHGCSLIQVPYNAVVRADNRTTIFRPKNVLSVLASFWRIFFWRFRPRRQPIRY